MYTFTEKIGQTIGFVIIIMAISIAVFGMGQTVLALSAQREANEADMLARVMTVPSIPLYAGEYSEESHCGSVYRRWYVVKTPVVTGDTMWKQVKQFNPEFQYSCNYTQKEDNLLVVWYRIASY